MDQAKPIHPRHPGVGSPTSLIRLEGDRPEIGGALLFFPSGAHCSIHWEHPSPITPVLDAAQQYVDKVIDYLRERGLEADIRATNWTSVTAALCAIIREWNSLVRSALNNKMALEIETKEREERRKRLQH